MKINFVGSSIGMAPLCLFCSRYRYGSDTWTCDAFPVEIPFDIIENGFDHRRPYPGDNGVLFDMSDAVPMAEFNQVFGPGNDNLPGVDRCVEE